MTREERREAFRIMKAFDLEHPGVATGSMAGPLVTAGIIDSINQARQTGELSAPYKTGFLTGCNVMWLSLAVLHDGTYVPCHQLPHIVLGKVGRDSLRDVWLNSPELGALRKRRNLPLSVDPRCVDCKYQKYCTGGCPAIAYALTNDVNKTNPKDCYRAYIDEDPIYVY